MHGQCAIRKVICDPATVTYVLLKYAKCKKCIVCIFPKLLSDPRMIDVIGALVGIDM